MDLPVMPPVAPMLAKPVDSIPTGDFIFEPKWDGFRSIVFRDGDEVEIGSRNERPMTRYFPELVTAFLAQLPDRCVIDGEIVLPDWDSGRLDFEALQLRLHPAESRVRLLAAQTPAHFVAFDLLALGDTSFVDVPFGERRGALEEALASAAPPVHLTPATMENETAAEWFSQFEGAGLDGLIAKPRSGPYVPDKRVMFKIKHERTADCVVAGYRPHKTGDDAVGSLLLGLYRDSGDGGAAGAPGGARPAGDDVRRAPLELGHGGGGHPHPAQLPVQPVERRQGPVVRAAAPGTGARGAVRPHGGDALPAHRAVRPLAARPHAFVVHVRTAGRACQLQLVRNSQSRSVISNGPG
jgi:ATP-dependent DNA ligase